MSKLLPIITSRLILRKPSISDLTDFQAYRLDPEVAQYQGWESTSDGEAREFLAGTAAAKILQPGQWCQIGIADGISNQLIGDIGIHISENEAEAEIGFSLRQQSQGQGLATEAVQAAINLIFQNTPVTHIMGITDARNEPSIRLLERIGMRYHKTEEAIFRGEPCQEKYYSLARPEA